MKPDSLGESKASREIFRFDDFELDRGTYELRQAGQRVRLQRLPLELLYLLVERHGQLVTREEIIERIWGKGVFVDSENSINTAMNKIRRALNDDADAPRFVVTVPARGYRFIAPVREDGSTLPLPEASPGLPVAEASPTVHAVDTSSTAITKGRPPPKNRRRGILASILGITLVIAVIVLIQQLSLRGPTTTASIPTTRSPALPLPDKPSIAVLPFTNMSGDREQEYFSDGITDDLITALSRLPDLFVIARTSTFTYKGKAAKVQDVSRELGVKYILEGSVQKARDQVRITAQLVDATTGAELWAQHYDRPMRDVFSLQDEIVQRIVTILNLQMEGAERGILVTKRTDNLDAYDYFLRGIEFFLFRNPTKDGNEKARQMFQKATELDPRYSDAYAELGWLLYVDQTNQWSRDPHGLERAIQLEQQSIALDNSNGFAYAAMSGAYASVNRPDLSIANAERALTFDPNSAFSYFCMSAALSASGKPAEALVAAHKAMRLDPHRRDFYSLTEGFAYMLAGRYEEAIPSLKTFLASYSNNIGAHLMLINCYVELGRNEDARAQAAEVLRINPQFSLAAQKRMSLIKGPLRDRLYADMAKAGLK
jgi:adenylate cyclase